MHCGQRRPPRFSCKWLQLQQLRFKSRNNFIYILKRIAVLLRRPLLGSTAALHSWACLPPATTTLTGGSLLLLILSGLQAEKRCVSDQQSHLSIHYLEASFGSV
ncbi:hypothetical protein ENH_00086440 [Eimeria necatrix]|uniref:Uncharacterized protein n=1 Tax=Eimeria necatrix TaxID=51315 RepID=U6N5F7_9EIME|nr:hypothetical protein ENH_00086440 [Eimeria necatrix]CDJ69135.1 hypothetical protein ENH_00086440 [Eimeria necatrix]